MRKFFYVFMFCLAAVSCKQAQETTVTVRMDKVKPNTELSLVTIDSVYKAKTGEDSKAVFRLPRQMDGYYASVEQKFTQVLVYIEPGRNFDLHIISGNRQELEFEGEGAEKNRYIHSDLFKGGNLDYKLDEKSFSAAVWALEKQFDAELDKKGFDDDFVKLEKKRNYYVAYKLLMGYNYKGKDVRGRGWEPGQAYYDELVSKFVEDSSFNYLTEYVDLIDNLAGIISFLDRPAGGGHKELMKHLYTKRFELYSKVLKSQPMLEYFYQKYMLECFRRFGIIGYDDLIAKYKSVVKDPARLAEFNTAYQGWKQIESGQPSPNFTYRDINGKEYSLTDFAGKYVYIDFWATWCGPCRMQLPHLKKLEKRFEGRNIVFLSISSDRDKAAWENLVRKDKMEGYQLHVGGNYEFMKYYQINGIPRFILIDPEGRIVKADMTRPSDPNIDNELNALKGI